jgi:hypothetical protein
VWSPRVLRPPEPRHAGPRHPRGGQPCHCPDNPTQACVNPTQACVNRTQGCVNRTQACVNVPQVGSPAAFVEVADRCVRLEWLQSTWAGCDALLNHSTKRDYTVTRLAGCFGPRIAEYVRPSQPLTLSRALTLVGCTFERSIRACLLGLWRSHPWPNTGPLTWSKRTASTEPNTRTCAAVLGGLSVTCPGGATTALLRHLYAPPFPQLTRSTLCAGTR